MTFEGLGLEILELVAPLLEMLATLMPGDIFPRFFNMEMMQRSLIASLMVTIVAGTLGVFLIIQNLSLIGDGLAHVSFGGVAVAIVLGATNPLWYALLFSVIAAILIHELQARDILTGDASIAIFLTGVLSIGLISLTVWGGGVTSDIHSYLFGSQLLIDKDTLNWITYVSIFALISMALIGPSLLACIVDPLAARVQGLPVKGVGLLFSIITACAVVTMVKVVGALLVTALLVTPAATAQLVGNSFRSCMIWTQVFGLTSVLGGLYLSSEIGAGSGSAIAFFAALLFAIVAISKSTANLFTQSNDN
jgi:zinc transport system permease protein|tara:strand:- start:1700 stop:2620 length:921 start_codon:yes stop_codon:yes gene_type:complete